MTSLEISGGIGGLLYRIRLRNKTNINSKILYPHVSHLVTRRRAVIEKMVQMIKEKRKEERKDLGGKKERK